MKIETPFRKILKLAFFILFSYESNSVDQFCEFPLFTIKEQIDSKKKMVKDFNEMRELYFKGKEKLINNQYNKFRDELTPKERELFLSAALFVKQARYKEKALDNVLDELSRVKFTWKIVKAFDDRFDFSIMDESINNKENIEIQSYWKTFAEIESQVDYLVRLEIVNENLAIKIYPNNKMLEAINLEIRILELKIKREGIESLSEQEFQDLEEFKLRREEIEEFRKYLGTPTFIVDIESNKVTIEGNSSSTPFDNSLAMSWREFHRIKKVCENSNNEVKLTIFDGRKAAKPLLVDDIFSEYQGTEFVPGGSHRR